MQTLESIRLPNPRLPALVVDDSRTTGALVARIVRSIGFESVEVCTNGLDALAMLRSAAHGLLLTDLEMNAFSGLDLIRCVRGDAAIRDLAIILMTAKIDKAAQMVERHEVSHADAHILKPFTPTQLKEKLWERFGSELLRSAAPKPGDCH